MSEKRWARGLVYGLGAPLNIGAGVLNIAAGHVVHGALFAVMGVALAGKAYQTFSPASTDPGEPPPRRIHKPPMTLGAVAHECVAGRTAKEVAGYESLLDNLIVPRWGDTPVKDITHADLNAGSAAYQRARARQW